MLALINADLPMVEWIIDEEDAGTALAVDRLGYQPPSPFSKKIGRAGWGKKAVMRENRSTPKMMRCAAELRRAPTPAESNRWACLRAHNLEGFGFRRQHAIGNYIVDFCAPSKKLVIEVDGSQHLEQPEYDAQRTAFLESKGYRVLRFWNNEVMNNIEGVVSAIIDALGE